MVRGRVGCVHFVADGHHRVSIAAANRQRLIDAYVTHVRTAAPPRPADVLCPPDQTLAATPFPYARTQMADCCAAFESP
jgi:hypothetical protein